MEPILATKLRIEILLQRDPNLCSNAKRPLSVLNRSTKLQMPCQINDNGEGVNDSAESVMIFMYKYTVVI